MAHDISVQHACDPLALSAASFARFARFITDELGIKMPDSKRTMVQSRLLRRVRELQLESVAQYDEYFFTSSNTEEREHFINVITTNKTDFFREADHFDYLSHLVLPAFQHATGGTGRLRVWSAGCSSGEEPYTLGMVLSEYALGHLGFDFAVLATDVSTKVLATARAGIYPESQIVPVPPELRGRYLLRSRNRTEHLVRTSPDLRRKISFHWLNFIDDDYCLRDMFDVIFFRNVMIYFDRDTREAVVNKICRNLAPGGYLFTGHSESLADLNVPLKPVKASVYVRSSAETPRNGLVGCGKR